MKKGGKMSELKMGGLEYRYVLRKEKKGMSGKIKEIYRNLLSETDYLKESGKDIERAIEELLQNDKLCLNVKGYEEVRDELFAVTSFAEEEGFIKGFQYAVMLMAECYKATSLL